MVPANVKLSKNELALVCDESVILTKNNIIQKVYEMFGSLSEVYKAALNGYHTLPDADILKQSPKIYRGEHYNGLPYVMLDYPRSFSHTDALAIRCFFWWGNFFSITLHLQGKYVPLYAGAIMQNHKEATQWYYCINEDKWQHHFETSNYIPLVDASIQTDATFLKVAKKIPLQQWDDVYDFFVKNFQYLVQLPVKKN